MGVKGKVFNPTGAGGFKPGVSGNPSGRPAMDPQLKQMALAKSPEAFAKVVQLLESTDQKIALAAAKEILDRAHGKPAQSVELSNVDNTPLFAAIQIIELVKQGANAAIEHTTPTISS